MKLKLFARKRSATETRNEQATFEALIEGCWDALWRYAYHTTGSAEEAEDLLSETLLEGFRSFGQFRGDTMFVRWMYRVMTTTRIDMTRRAARRKTESLEAMLEGPIGNEGSLADGNANPEAIIVGPMLSEPVQQALAGLSEEYRAVVVLADMETNGLRRYPQPANSGGHGAFAPASSTPQPAPIAGRVCGRAMVRRLQKIKRSSPRRRTLLS